MFYIKEVLVGIFICSCVKSVSQCIMWSTKLTVNLLVLFEGLLQEFSKSSWPSAVRVNRAVMLCIGCDTLLSINSDIIDSAFAKSHYKDVMSYCYRVNSMCTVFVDDE